jgi:hypothetical protein
MKFHEPPFYGQDCLFHQRFIQRASLIIRNGFDVKPFDFTCRKDIVTKMGKQMQMLLLSWNAHEFRKLSWPALNMSLNLKVQKSLESAKFCQTITRQDPPIVYLYMVQGGIQTLLAWRSHLKSLSF